MEELKNQVHEIADTLELLCKCDPTEDYMDIYDWLDDQLEVSEYRFWSNGDFKGAEVLCTCGGPTLWVDTYNTRVIGTSGSNRYEYPYSDDWNILSDLVEELANSIFE